MLPTDEPFIEDLAIEDRLLAIAEVATDLLWKVLNFIRIT
jgi:hypothetical protein